MLRLSLLCAKTTYVLSQLTTVLVHSRNTWEWGWRERASANFIVTIATSAVVMWYIYKGEIKGLWLAGHL